MNLTPLVHAAFSFTLISWGIAGLAFAWSVWKATQSRNEDDGDDGPPPPDDPESDPGDWWKRNGRFDPTHRN